MILRPRKAKGKASTDGDQVALESKASEGGSVVLDLSFSGEYWRKIEEFLEQRTGFLTKQETSEALAILLEYGASTEAPPTPLSVSQKFALSGEYSSLHFKQFECFKENRDIALGLRVHIDANRLLKRRLAELRGAQAVPHDEWDSWDEATIARYYEKYVFAR